MFIFLHHTLYFGCFNLFDLPIFGFQEEFFALLSFIGLFALFKIFADFFQLPFLLFLNLFIDLLIIEEPFQVSLLFAELLAFGGIGLGLLVKLVEAYFVVGVEIVHRATWCIFGVARFVRFVGILAHL